MSYDDDEALERKEAELLGLEQPRREVNVKSHPNKHVIALNAAWRTEIAAPEILPIPESTVVNESIVVSLLRLLRQQETEVSGMRSETTNVEQVTHQPVLEPVVVPVPVHSICCSVCTYSLATYSPTHPLPRCLPSPISPTSSPHDTIHCRWGTSSP